MYRLRMSGLDQPIHHYPLMHAQQSHWVTEFGPGPTRGRSSGGHQQAPGRAGLPTCGGFWQGNAHLGSVPQTRVPLTYTVTVVASMYAVVVP